MSVKQGSTPQKYSVSIFIFMICCIIVIIKTGNYQYLTLPLT